MTRMENPDDQKYFGPLRSFSAWYDEIREKEPPIGIKTGLPIFDSEKGDVSTLQTLIALTGAPGAGKTTLAMNMAVAMVKAGHPLLYLYMESGLKDDIIRRLYSIYETMGLSEESKQRFYISDRNDLIAAYLARKKGARRSVKKDEFGNSEIITTLTKIIEETFEKNLDQMEGTLPLKEARSPVIILDSLHTFPHLGSENVRLQTDEVMSFLSQVGTLAIPGGNPTCITICHTSRENSSRIGKEFLVWKREKEAPYELTSMVAQSGKESGGIEYQARAVLYVHREMETGKIFVICGKNTYGDDAGKIQECTMDGATGIITPRESYFPGGTSNFGGKEEKLDKDGTW